MSVACGQPAQASILPLLPPLTSYSLTPSFPWAESLLPDLALHTEMLRSPGEPPSLPGPQDLQH